MIHVARFWLIWSSLMHITLYPAALTNSHEADRKKRVASAYPLPMSYFAIPQTHYRDRIDLVTQIKTRPTIIVLHYTASSTLHSPLRHFRTNPHQPVSAHFIVDPRGTIINLVSIYKTAYHAGVSYWRNQTNINPYSIGIELCNTGYTNDPEDKIAVAIPGSPERWTPFDTPQITSCIQLVHYLQKQFNIASHDIIGHSDCAPGRKSDPGPRFPWQKLAQNGIGTWPMPEYTPAPIPLCRRQTHNLSTWMIDHLHLYGYMKPSPTTSATAIIQAFQMHYRQTSISGAADPETADILINLLRQRRLIEGTQCFCNLRAYYAYSF